MHDREALADIVVIGRSCRLPGAANVDELWSNLIAGRCSISQIPADRWSLDKHGHPRPKEPGRSYTWAAGVLEDIWSFDPAAFGISPREAEQMDPQQRLLLELTWEALEDAGIRRSSIAGSPVGVFVGASGFDFSVVRATDMAGGDAYTATGGALSIISNRISHAFDLKGPSYTVDTACSSSLVALDQAMQALKSGRVDTAIVGGVNLLTSPFGFVTFSQASMLSPTGLCRTFDASADGYVRAEGGVVLVLKTAERATADGARAYARLVASGVNSDGHTNGISLPSRFSQAQLLQQVYSRAGIDPDDIAFVEAHGTGTRVGDPIEAGTIGENLGRARREPLLVGSIKSNIGHLEPASGLAGVLKSMLALEHDVLPPSINFAEPNPEIAFDELNLKVCAEATALPRKGDGLRFAGVNSFGFGGTNAHVILADAPRAKARSRAKPQRMVADRFALSAASRPALRELARLYADQLEHGTSDAIAEVAAAAIHRRELMGERLVVEWQSPRDLVRKLERVADKDDEIPGATWGSVVEPGAPVAFVFSGNGGQWPGMGRTAYRTNARFREAFDEVDALFDSQFGWSATEALFAPDLEERIRFTHVAQPLIFGVQIATARALIAEGLSPSFTLGHSVGEVAAAQIAGALTLKDAVHVIHARSTHQELAHDAGRMAVVVGTRERVEALAEEIGGVSIAAFNSPRTFTVSGPTDRIKALGQAARKKRIVFRQLDLEYPFHCGLIDVVREPLLRDLAHLRGQKPSLSFISTVTGEPAGDLPLDAEYWWHNVREPVHFDGAISHAADLGARIFVEIGPRSVLLGNINEIMEPSARPFAALGVLEKTEGPDEADPIRPAIASAFVRGAAIDVERVFGPEPHGLVALPIYPWQRRDFRVSTTSEAVGFTLATAWHRLIGARDTADGTEWHGLLDTAALPELADHKVGGQAILPGAAFVEIALAVARDWFQSETASLIELDIMQALPLEHDRAREIMARLSPTTHQVEILSRPRLSRADWQLHAVAKISKGEGEPFISPVLPEGGKAIPLQTVYAAAESVGLDYGPAFRLARGVTRFDDRTLLVELAPSAPKGVYRIDPAPLDACFHGLFVLFEGLGAEEAGTAYLPVRFGPVRVAKPGAAPTRGLIRIVRADQRAIVADFTLLDGGGDVVATLSAARFQAARVKRSATLAEFGLVIDTVLADAGTLGLPGADAQVDDVLGAAKAMEIVAGADETESAEQMMLEGFASAAGYEIARSVSASGTISPDLIASLPAHVAPWLVNILHNLEASGLAEMTDAGWQVADTSDLPPAPVVLRALAEESPHRSAELLLAAPFTAIATQAPAWQDGFDPSPAPGVVAGFELEGASARGASATLEALLRRTDLLAGHKRALRILQIGYGPLSHALAALADETDARLTIFDPDPRRLELARLGLGSGRAVAFVGGPDGLEKAGYDVLLAADALHRLATRQDLADIQAAAAPGAMLVAIEPLPSHFRDLTLGLDPRWFGGAAASDFPVGALRSETEWQRLLSGLGFASPRATLVKTGHETAALLVATTSTAASQEKPLERRILVEAAPGTPLADALASQLATAGHTVARQAGQGVPEAIVFVAERGGAGEVAALRDIALALKDTAEAHAAGKAEFWLVLPAVAQGDPLADPVVTGIAAYSRTLANEYAGLKVKRVALAAGLAPDKAAASVATLIASGSAETDFVITAEGCRVLRVQQPTNAPLSAPRAEAARLERGANGGLAGLSWSAAAVAKPAAGEVQIAVEASGLNFRDVMWALSLLPDEVLEDGFAGPSLGLECAGRVTAIGQSVSHVQPGDRVVAFAPAAFATSVTVPGGVVARIPDDLPTEAAATIPVAFLTAYYSLVTLGQLKAGQSVLIHGGAGGVGLAAIQIAQWLGAGIVATAGTEAKRDLLRSLGVRHVLNSRSSAFADAIRATHPDGVDVLLNSLSGEAMERGLSVLKPFGRFIELGKRDYVANTHVGLRPFRRNLSYFGVDVDQLLSDRDRASAVFAELMALVAEGVFRPLPYRVFPATETTDAFRLMQRSGHVGKIVVTPPRQPVAAAGQTPRFDPERTHLITGGFGGFGLEAARWLADRGVRNLVLVGRSGPGTPEARALVADLTDRGVNVRAAACDVADERALSALLADIRASMPPLAGIMHAAMVLEDGVIANLDADQLTRVLTPKVEGARLLDRLTEADALDYLVLFSSVTTFVGNPGQGAYVAANGYLEGLARQRRARGKPALAVAWGAISDVGVLARDEKLAEVLAKRTGVKAIPAREALDLMVQAMRRSRDDIEGAVVAVGALDWSAARRLPALASPTFAALLREGTGGESAERSSIDLKALLASKDQDAVRLQVADVIAEEIAGVLRVPKQDVNKTKRLAEIGLDSLMAIELVTALQDRFELTSPPTGSVGTLSVIGLADHLIASVQGATADEELRVTQSLNDRHAGIELDAAALAPVTEAVNERSRQLRGLLQ